MKIKSLTIGLIASLAFCGAAHAEDVSFKYTATQTIVSGPFTPGGDPETASTLSEITGTFSYDAAAIDPNGATPELGVYETGYVAINGLTYVTDYNRKVTIILNNVGFDSDGIDIFMQRDEGNIREEVSLQLEDNEGTVFSNSDLPTELSLDDFERRNLYVFRYDFVTETSEIVFFEITSLERVPDDSDGDGVEDDVDACPGTVIPESAPSSGKLGNARYALADPESTTFTGGKSTQTIYTTEDTAGCSCDQIVEMLDLGKGQLKAGCSISTLEDWTSTTR